jgi:hypothetical protein
MAMKIRFQDLGHVIMPGTVALDSVDEDYNLRFRDDRHHGDCSKLAAMILRCGHPPSTCSSIVVSIQDVC